MNNQRNFASVENKTKEKCSLSDFSMTHAPCSMSYKTLTLTHNYSFFKKWGLAPSGSRLL